jgi:hypothetical protein
MADKTRVIRLVADASQFKKELGELVTATKKVAEASEKTAKSMGKIEGLGKNIGTAIKAMASAAAALGALKAIGQAAEDMDNLYKASQRAGIGIEGLTSLGYAAEMAGSSIAGLQLGIKHLNRTLVDVDTATSKSAKALRALGVTGADSAEEAFKKIADQFARMPDGANKSALAMAALGKSGTELIPTLNGGSEGLKEMADQAERLGLVIDENTARRAEAFNDDIATLKSAMVGATRQITAGMLPALGTMAEKMADAAHVTEEFAKTGAYIGDVMIELAATALHTSRAISTFAKGIGALGAIATPLYLGKLDEVREIWNMFSQDAVADAIAMENRIKDLRATYERNKVDRPQGSSGGGVTDDVGTDWAETGGSGSTTKRSLPKYWQDALAEAEKYFDALIKIRDEMGAASSEVADLEQIAEAWEKGERAGKAMEESLARQNELIQWKKDNPEVTDADVAKMNELLAKRDELNGKIGETQAKIQQDMDNAKQAADAVSGVFVDWATGIIDAEGALKGFVAILLDFLAKKYVMDFLMNSFGGGEANAKGAAWAGGVKLMAKGGVLNSATAMGIAGGKMQIAGEAGPEGVLPLRRDRSGNLGVIASGRPQLSVVVNNNAGVDVSTSISPDGGLTLDIVRKAISNDIARGGSSVARSLERTYGMGRGR